jgi:hypothetical protein
MAVYWKAVAVYAGHARRLCRQKTPKTASVMNGPDMNEMPGQQMIHELIAFLAKHRGTRFVARNLSTGIFSFFDTIYDATTACIEANRLSADHPSFELLDSFTGEYIGRLSRCFGEDFYPRNCWSKPE